MPIPERISSPTLNDYLEVMSRAIFQAGLRWALIDAKWNNFRTAFHNFDVNTVASFTDNDVERLLKEQGIIRSKAKIEATISNANQILKLDKEYAGFDNFLKSFKSYEAASKDLKKRFKFMGELNAYYFLFRVRQPVPVFEKWLTTIPGEHPRMREMVEHSREQDRLREAG